MKCGECCGIKKYIVVGQI